MSSQSRNNSVDNAESPGAEGSESRLAEGQEASTVDGDVTAGNGVASRTDSSAPLRRSDGREERAVARGVDQGYDREAAAARGRSSTTRDEPVSDAEDRRDRSNGAAGPGDDADGELILIDNGDAFRSQWESVQIGFVDDPRQAVQDAQDLLSSVVDELIDSFRRTLDDTLAGDDDRSTDQLRHTFRRYRVLFERLLST
jgi:hypothetical protein